MFDASTPLFLQIATRIENDIVDGTLAEETQVPSTNEFAAFYRINPATAGKGVNLLVDRGILYKKRGIGMFIATGARERLLAERRAEFVAQYVAPLLTEATKLGIDHAQLLQLLSEAEDTSPARSASARTSRTQAESPLEKDAS